MTSHARRKCSSDVKQMNIEYRWCEKSFKPREESCYEVHIIGNGRYRGNYISDKQTSYHLALKAR
jgi:hypothetical protein